MQLGCDNIQDCLDVCACLMIESPDETIIVNKLVNRYGCKFQLQVDMDNLVFDETVTVLTYDPILRRLTYVNELGASNVIQLSNDLQNISLNGTTLTLSKGGGSVNLANAFNSLQVPFAATSSSLTITPGGTYGHTPDIEVKISADPCNPLMFGSDGGLFFSIDSLKACMGCDPCPPPICNASSGLTVTTL